jgi:preprotein translocase subunit SecB
MDNKSSDNVEVALIQHQLLSCNAETIIKPSPDMGGNIEISINVNTPKSPGILKKNDTFAISVQIGVIGKVKDTKDIAFNVSCEMEGSYRLINCDDNGIPTNNNINLWISSTRQLFPLVALFTTDLISRLGFKNINVPAFVPSQFLLQTKPEKKSSKKSKK